MEAYIILDLTRAVSGALQQEGGLDQERVHRHSADDNEIRKSAAPVEEDQLRQLLAISRGVLVVKDWHDTG